MDITQTTVTGEYTTHIIDTQAHGWYAYRVTLTAHLGHDWCLPQAKGSSRSEEGAVAAAALALATLLRTDVARAAAERADLAADAQIQARFTATAGSSPAQAAARAAHEVGVSGQIWDHA